MYTIIYRENVKCTTKLKVPRYHDVRPQGDMECQVGTVEESVWNIEMVWNSGYFFPYLKTLFV